MVLLTDFPSELLTEIISFALLDHSVPTHILSVNALFLSISQQILHRDLRFQSVLQLRRFYAVNEPLACRPRSLTLELPGGVSDPELFNHLRYTFNRCTESLTDHRDAHCFNLLELDTLRLRLNSHSRDNSEGGLYNALCTASASQFIWTGPDPPHHFSIAIVPLSTINLFRALSTYTNLRHLHLTNIAFPTPMVDPSLSLSSPPTIFPSMPSLRSLYLGQATFLLPSSIATLCLRSKNPSRPTTQDVPSYALERVHLVDVYQNSIWGLRVRRSDIEVAAVVLAKENIDDRDVIDLVRKLVVCEARTERIMGGDRVDVTFLN